MEADRLRLLRCTPFRGQNVAGIYDRSKACFTAIVAFFDRRRSVKLDNMGERTVLIALAEDRTGQGLLRERVVREGAVC